MKTLEWSWMLYCQWRLMSQMMPNQLFVGQATVSLSLLLWLDHGDQCNGYLQVGLLQLTLLRAPLESDLKIPANLKFCSAPPDWYLCGLTFSQYPTNCIGFQLSPVLDQIQCYTMLTFKASYDLGLSIRPWRALCSSEHLVIPSPKAICLVSTIARVFLASVPIWWNTLPSESRVLRNPLCIKWRYSTRSLVELVSVQLHWPPLP